MLAAFLLAPALVIGQDSRDLLSQYAGKRMTMLFQTIPGSPFGAGGTPPSSLLGSNNVWTGTNEYDGTATFDAAVLFNTNVDFVGAVSVNNTSIFNGTATFNFGVTIAESSSVTTGKFLAFGGAGQFGEIMFNSDQTPDTVTFTLPTGSNTVEFIEDGDETFDFNSGPCGTSVCTNPQVVVRDKDQNTTNYQAHGVSGLSGRFVKTLTESAATSVVIIPVAAATSVAGMMLYTVHARDATNTQTRSGRIIWNGVAEGTTATCVIGTAEELDNTPTGTLTAAITCTSPASNQIQLLINAASSLTQTTLEAYVQLFLVGAGEPLPQ